MADTPSLFPSIPTATEVDKRERDHEVDRTPRGLVREVLAKLIAAHKITKRDPDITRTLVTVAGQNLWLSPGAGHWGREGVAMGRPLRILDVCAGAGVWSSEARRLFGLLGVPVETTAVEIRPEERERLRKWADHVVIAELIKEVLLRPSAREALGTFDLTIGNPHFTGLHSMLVPLLGMSRAVAMYHTANAFQRGRVGQQLVHDHPPALELRLGGSVKHRNGRNPETGNLYGAATDCYCVTAWVGDREPGSPWLTVGLPLEAATRKWIEIPGAESVGIDDCPTAPGWEP